MATRKTTAKRPAAKRAGPKKPVSSTPPGLTPCLWFDKNALEAAEFYVSVFPRSRITDVLRSPADNPSTKKGEVLLVEFKLDGKPFQALNGGPYFKLSEAVSFVVDCKDQAEMDRYYDALSAVPEAEQCGWVKDKFGVSWQLTPRALVRLLASRDAAKAQRVMEAMLPMKRLDVAALEAAGRAAPRRKAARAAR
ncbi:MAG TPA: VOC family protein [Candidatus Thermoplasmatota archaeon]|nr:VOC family protein [Candidatus Thermoplasmatota archaeon]